jgi:hypothetical protein
LFFFHHLPMPHPSPGRRMGAWGVERQPAPEPPSPVRQREEPAPRAGLRGSVAKAARGTPDSRATPAGRSPGVPRPSTPAGRSPGVPRPSTPAGRVPGSRDPRLPRAESRGPETLDSRRPSPGVPRPSTPAGRVPGSRDPRLPRAESRGPETLDSRRPSPGVPTRGKPSTRPPTERKSPGEQNTTPRNQNEQTEN